MTAEDIQNNIDKNLLHQTYKNLIARGEKLNTPKIKELTKKLTKVLDETEQFYRDNANKHHKLAQKFNAMTRIEKEDFINSDSEDLQYLEMVENTTVNQYDYMREIRAKLQPLIIRVEKRRQQQ